MLISALLGMTLLANRLPARIYFSEERNNFVVVLSHFLPWKVRKFDCVPGDMICLLYTSDAADE